MTDYWQNTTSKFRYRPSYSLRRAEPILKQHHGVDSLLLAKTLGVNESTVVSHQRALGLRTCTAVNQHTEPELKLRCSRGHLFREGSYVWTSSKRAVRRGGQTTCFKTRVCRHCWAVRQQKHDMMACEQLFRDLDKYHHDDRARRRLEAWGEEIWKRRHG